MDLILASTSPYRRKLLERLQLPFRCIAPGTDESSHRDEQPAALAGRLARAKAQSIAREYPDAIIIGSDQVASLNGNLMGKPGTYEAAVTQLTASSGQSVRFHTGVALACAGRRLDWFHVEPFTAHFRQLTGTTIEDYLRREQPYDCAGSFKCEGLGIALFERLEGNDPTSLEGLPLIALTALLTRAGLAILQP